MEESLQETFLPALFQGLVEGAPGRGVTRLPVKQAGLSLPYPRNMATENWTASCVITCQLVASLRGQVDFRTAYDSACLREGQTAVRGRSVLLAERALAETISGGPV